MAYQLIIEWATPIWSCASVPASHSSSLHHLREDRRTTTTCHAVTRRCPLATPRRLPACLPALPLHLPSHLGRERSPSQVSRRHRDSLAPIPRGRPYPSRAAQYHYACAAACVTIRGVCGRNLPRRSRGGPGSTTGVPPLRTYCTSSATCTGPSPQYTGAPPPQCRAATCKQAI